MTSSPPEYLQKCIQTIIQDVRVQQIVMWPSCDKKFNIQKELELFFYEKTDVSPPFDVKSISH